MMLFFFKMVDVNVTNNQQQVRVLNVELFWPWCNLLTDEQSLLFTHHLL